jgi:hypothetical protein
MPYNNYNPYYNPVYYGQQPQGISGRVVNDFNEVVANDVPMNGTYAFFVKQDMSEIQARAWSADGKIVPIVFKPVFDNNPHISIQNTEKSVLGANMDVTGVLEEIKERLTSIEESMNKTSRRKKEVDPE